MFRKKSLAVAVFALFGAISLFSVSVYSKSGPLALLEKSVAEIGDKNSLTGFIFPAEMAGLKLSHFFQGKEAMAKIDKLHGKEIEMKNGYVAHYQGNRARAMLYISEFDGREQARQQLDLMKEKIKKGVKGFAHFREFKVKDLSVSQPQKAGKTIYLVMGFGQVHYFYLDSSRVIWLAVDPSVAGSVLKAALKEIK